MFTATLPYPPSINHYWRHFRGHTVISREGRTFRTNVCSLMAARGGNGPRKPPMGGRIALAMDAFPPDFRRRDIDNTQKATLDALQHAGIYLDDSQIDIGCPYHNNEEWRLIQSDPDLWADVVEVDDAIRHADGMEGQVFLHRSCRPLREVDLRTPEEKGQSVLPFARVCSPLAA